MALTLPGRKTSVPESMSDRFRSSRPTKAETQMRMGKKVRMRK